MTKVEIKSKLIRDLLNLPWKLSMLWSDRVNFNKAFTSLDVIEDAQEAIKAYQLLPQFHANSGGYLYIYGLMQSLFLQQDGVLSLHKALFDKNINLKQQFPKLQSIREHRRLSVGHPTNSTKGKSKAFTYLIRMSLNKKEFKYLTHYPEQNDDSEHIEVDVEELIKNQELEISIILDDIICSLKQENAKHKSKFSDRKLMDIVNRNYKYHIRKLYSAVGKNHNHAKLDFGILNDNYRNIKKEILTRYHSTFGVQGIEYNFEQLDYLFERLEQDLVLEQIDDQKELVVFIDSLQNHFEELVELCKEVDEVFEDKQ
ncbi:MAG: hypothetical protein AB3N18_10675 [Allomuricauda sp.]